MEQEKNTLTVLEIAPGQYPKQVEIDPDLKALQQAVGGSIGASYPFADDPVAIIYNDDGKLMGLPLNRALRDEDGSQIRAGLFSRPAGAPAAVRGCHLRQRRRHRLFVRADRPRRAGAGF